MYGVHAGVGVADAWHCGFTTGPHCCGLDGVLQFGVGGGGLQIELGGGPHLFFGGHLEAAANSSAGPTQPGVHGSFESVLHLLVEVGGGPHGGFSANVRHAPVLVVQPRARRNAIGIRECIVSSSIL